MRHKTLERSSEVVLPYAWVILAVIYLASVVAPFNQFKVPPILPVLMDVFQVNLTQAGALMSILAVIGLVLALPAGIILQRLGPKITTLIAMGGLAAGSALGALSGSFGSLLAGRVIEGVGISLVSLAAPEIMRRPQWAGLGLAAVLVGQNLGVLAGPVIFSQLVNNLGWAMAGYLMIPVCLAGFLSG